MAWNQFGKYGTLESEMVSGKVFRHGPVVELYQAKFYHISLGNS